MAKLREKQSHLWERDEFDWYVEPRECSLALFRHENFFGKVWDPACGSGRIIEIAKYCGIEAVGSDIVTRSEYCEREIDFLGGVASYPDFLNIVMNPPFKHAEEFVRKAIDIAPASGKIAAILPIVWLAGFSSKRNWLPLSPLRKVFPISPRPSMPPGAVIRAGERPGNGTKDFCWLVWEKGYSGKAEVEFLNTSEARRELSGKQKQGEFLL